MYLVASARPFVCLSPLSRLNRLSVYHQSACADICADAVDRLLILNKICPIFNP